MTVRDRVRRGLRIALILLLLALAVLALLVGLTLAGNDSLLPIIYLGGSPTSHPVARAAACAADVAQTALARIRHDFALG
jgi:hypothetical protein